MQQFLPYHLPHALEASVLHRQIKKIFEIMRHASCVMRRFWLLLKSSPGLRLFFEDFPVVRLVDQVRIAANPPEVAERRLHHGDAWWAAIHDKSFLQGVPPRSGSMGEFDHPAGGA